MSWIKKGLIYCPKGEYGWDDNTVMTPAPFLLNENTIRIYAGFRDEHGRSRIGFLDVDADDPGRIRDVSSQPVIELGAPGAFDDSGMILGDVVRDGDTIRLYYIGFHIPQDAKFEAFSGLALSHDGGHRFQRVSEAPVLGRADDARFIHAIHTVLLENGVWRIWYSAGSGWEIINGQPYPQYDIRYVESEDGINFDKCDSVACLLPAQNEYRIGRPRVRVLDDGSYEMRFTSDTLDKQYRAGYARSADGVRWTRVTEAGAIDVAATGWDSEMLCYPAVLQVKDRTYMFYSGNGMGRTGVGYAEWQD